jgi:hypothetical protein
VREAQYHAHYRQGHIVTALAGLVDFGKPLLSRRTASRNMRPRDQKESSIGLRSMMTARRSRSLSEAMVERGSMLVSRAPGRKERNSGGVASSLLLKHEYWN